MPPYLDWRNDVFVRVMSIDGCISFKRKISATKQDIGHPKTPSYIWGGGGLFIRVYCWGLSTKMKLCVHITTPSVEISTFYLSCCPNSLFCIHQLELPMLVENSCLFYYISSWDFLCLSFLLLMHVLWMLRALWSSTGGASTGGASTGGPCIGLGYFWKNSSIVFPKTVYKFCQHPQ